MKTRKLLTAGAAGLAGLGLAGFTALPAVAAPASTRTIGTCSAQGDYATCVASGTTNYPRTRTLTVTVTSTPRQTVSVYWDMVCSQGLGAGSRSGSFTARTPVTRTIPHPYRQPNQCIVSADAQLQAGGNSIHLTLKASS